MLKRITLRPAEFATCLLAALLLASWSLADDTVIVATGKEGRGRSRLSGTVLDFTGKELRIKQASGREAVVPADKVVSVETTKEAKHTAADGLFESGDFAKAIAIYRDAAREEKRIWVQRQIMAQTVWCSRNLGQVERAGNVFLILVEDDPDTRFFDAIPLNWTAMQPPAALEQQAKTWLGGKLSPAVLMGASWLLSTDRAAAQGALEKLVADGDQRVAQLAAAQLWRTKLVTAKPEELDRWQVAVERLPAPLRAGPYYLLGEALARHERHSEAAIAYLRVPLDYPLHRYLAPDALFGAGRELEALGVPAEAASVYRELATDYPTAPRAPEAQRRLESLTKLEREK